MNHESYSQPPDLSPAQAASLRSPEPLCLNCGMERAAHGRFESCDGRETHWQAAPRLLFTSGSWLHDPHKPAPEPVPYTDAKKVKKGEWALPVNPPRERKAPAPKPKVKAKSMVKREDVTVASIMEIRKADGASVNQIAERLKCSAALVHYRVKRVGASKAFRSVKTVAKIVAHERTDITAERLMEMMKAGDSMAGAARKLKCSISLTTRRLMEAKRDDPAFAEAYAAAWKCGCGRPKRICFEQCKYCGWLVRKRAKTAANPKPLAVPCVCGRMRRPKNAECHECRLKVTRKRPSGVCACGRKMLATSAACCECNQRENRRKQRIQA